MKTALLLSGFAREFESCYPSLEANILNYNDCDIFMHVYEDENTERVLELYCPTEVLVTDPNGAENIRMPNTVLLPPELKYAKPVFGQWMNIKHAFDLLFRRPEYALEYECVVRTRFDIKYTQPIEFCNHDLRKLNVPIGGDYRGGLFDMFAFGDPFMVMQPYCTLYDRMCNYTDTENGQGVLCHSETLNRYNIEDQGLDIERIDYPILLRKQFDRPFVEDKIFTRR